MSSISANQQSLMEKSKQLLIDTGYYPYKLEPNPEYKNPKKDIQTKKNEKKNTENQLNADINEHINYINAPDVYNDQIVAYEKEIARFEKIIELYNCMDTAAHEIKNYERILSSTTDNNDKTYYSEKITYYKKKYDNSVNEILNILKLSDPSVIIEHQDTIIHLANNNIIEAENKLKKHKEENKPSKNPDVIKSMESKIEYLENELKSINYELNTMENKYNKNINEINSILEPDYVKYIQFVNEAKHIENYPHDISNKNNTDDVRNIFLNKYININYLSEILNNIDKEVKKEYQTYDIVTKKIDEKYKIIKSDVLNNYNENPITKTIEYVGPAKSEDYYVDIADVLYNKLIADPNNRPQPNNKPQPRKVALVTETSNTKKSVRRVVIPNFMLN
jgi:hypothetical protein